MPVLKQKLIQTSDGSHTIAIPELDEQYHSTNGAVQESKHVFIEAGFKALQSHNEINIFEMGFGTGLNCLLSFMIRDKQKINYTSIEKYPVIPELIDKLNFVDFVGGNSKIKEVFSRMHASEWDKEIELSADFKLQKYHTQLSSFVPKNQFDLIYYDAFAPDIQPDLWTKEMLAKVVSWMNKSGVFVTYCAKGVVRRNLQVAGLTVERLPGPPGKREMLRAIKAE